MNFSLSLEVIGLCASIFAELTKLIPQLSKTPLVSSLVAMAVVLVACLFTGGLTWQSFFNGLLYAFLNYQIIVQPTAKTIGSSTQA